MRDEEKRIQKGMGKLVATGKKLINRDIPTDHSTDTSDNELPFEKPIGDFSSDDLIRHRIAEPELFNEPPQANLANDDILVLSNDASSPNVTESSSVWSLSLNPFSYYMRGNRSRPQAAVEQEPPQRTASSVGRVASVPDDASLNPQCSSTPN